MKIWKIEEQTEENNHLQSYSPDTMSIKLMYSLPAFLGAFRLFFFARRHHHWLAWGLSASKWESPHWNPAAEPWTSLCSILTETEELPACPRLPPPPPAQHYFTHVYIAFKKLIVKLKNNNLYLPSGCGLLSRAGKSYYLYQYPQNKVWCLIVAPDLGHSRHPTTVSSRHGVEDN